MGLSSIFYSIINIYIRFLYDLTFQSLPALEVRSFFMSYFLDVTPFHNTIIPWYLYIIHHFFNFCSRIVNIIAEIFIPTRVFVYKSWTIYKIQNIQNTKFFADYKIQNTKFIFYIDIFFFLEHLKSPLNKRIYLFLMNKMINSAKKTTKKPIKLH